MHSVLLNLKQVPSIESPSEPVQKTHIIQKKKNMNLCHCIN